MAEPQTTSEPGTALTGAVIQEPKTVPQGVAQECINTEDRSYCSISKRPCVSDNDCTLVLIS